MLGQLQIVLASFQRYQVRYLVIGGIAAVLHGVPRVTFDLDILIESTRENAQRLLDAMLAAGLDSAALTTAEELLSKEITIFKDRVRLDVMTEAPGLIFSQAWERRVTMTYAGQSFEVLSLDDLLSSKRAAGRAVDLEDVQTLTVDDMNSMREE
jgi:hypothetical protein